MNFWGFSRSQLKGLFNDPLIEQKKSPQSETSIRIRLKSAKVLTTAAATGQVVDFAQTLVAPVAQPHLFSEPSSDELLHRQREKNTTIFSDSIFPLTAQQRAEKYGRKVGLGGKGWPVKDEPYDPEARDGDNDGIVQEGTAWERPAGTRIIDADGIEIRAGRISSYRAKTNRVIDADGNAVDYVPSYQRSEAGTIGETVGMIRPDGDSGEDVPTDVDPDSNEDSAEDLLSDLEAMFNEMLGEENTESPDAVIRDLEEMFDGLEQQMREDREQSEREAEERRIAREEADRENLKEQQEPLPFEASMPADGYGPSTLSDPEDQSFVRYRLRAAQLSDDELDGLAEAPDERLKEYIRELRERSQQGMALANDVDNYTQRSLTERGLGFEPDVARSVDYSIAYYQNMIADYLDDRLSARQDIETVDEKPLDEGIRGVMAWLDRVSEDVERQIELAEREEAGLGNDEVDGGEDYEVGIKDGQYVSGPITFSPDELDEAEKVFRDLVPEAFEDMGMFDGFNPDPADRYLDLDDPNEKLVLEFDEDAKYEEKLSPPRQPTDEDRPSGVPDYLWEMYVEDQTRWAEPFGEDEDGEKFVWMRTEKFTYWLNRLVESEKRRIDSDLNVNHLHEGVFDFIPSNPVADKKEWTNQQKLAQQIGRLQSLEFKNETVGSMGAMILAMDYRDYRANLSKQLFTSGGRRFTGRGTPFQVKPLTLREYLEVVNERGVKSQIGDRAQDLDMNDRLEEFMDIMLGGADNEDGGLLGFLDPDSQKLWDEVSDQIEEDKMKKERVEKEPSDLAVQEDLSVQEDDGFLLGPLRFGDIAETEEAFDKEEARKQKIIDRFGGKDKYDIDAEPEDVYIDLDDANPDRLNPEYPEKDSRYYLERTTPPKLPTMDDMPEELEDGDEEFWELYLDDQEDLSEQIEPGRYFRLNTFPYWLARWMDEERKAENKSRLINHMHDRRFALKEVESTPKKINSDIRAIKGKFEEIFADQGWPEGNPDVAGLLTIASAYQAYISRVSGAIVFDKNKARKQIVPLTMEQFIEVVAARGLGGTGFGEDFPLRPRE